MFSPMPTRSLLYEQPPLQLSLHTHFWSPHDCVVVVVLLVLLISVQNLFETFVVRDFSRQSFLFVVFEIGDKLQQVQVGFFD